MSETWTPTVTSNHQDHVIAHVVGAAVLGHFTIDEALHLILDMGFIWTIYLNAEMALLPQGVAIDELEIASDTKQQLSRDVELLQRDSLDAEGLALVKRAPGECLIMDISVLAQGDGRRVLIVGEEANLVVETSPATGGIDIYME